MEICVIEPPGVHYAGMRITCQRCSQLRLQIVGIRVNIFCVRNGKHIHRREMIQDNCPDRLGLCSVGVERITEVGVQHRGIKAYRHCRVITIRQNIGAAERIYHIAHRIEGAAAIDAVRGRRTGEKIAELRTCKAWKRPQQRPKIPRVQAGKCRKVSVNSLPKSIRADGIGKRLTLLLRHDDDKIAGAQFLYGQIQHDPCAECCVQAKIYGLIVRQLPGQQSAVNAESGCTAAHKNKTRFIAFRGQQGTLGGQFPHKRIAVLRGQGKAPHRQEQRYGDKNAEHTCKQFFHGRVRIGSR